LTKKRKFGADLGLGLYGFLVYRE